ncbi:MAG: hypothetical protein Q8R33_22955 [Burkholderiales bacterium]|nr:hypothetical protein [Burkholderiales bacterium]
MFCSRYLGVRLVAIAACFGLNASLAAAQPAPRPGTVVKPAAPAALPPLHIPTTHPRILLNDPATKARLQDLLKSASPAAARFQTQVSGQLMGAKAYAYQPWYSALMFQLTGEVRFAKHAIDETERFVASEEDKISKNQRAAVAGDSYLEIGQQIGNVALVYDWCHEHLTPAQRERWANYSNLAVGNVWNHTQARWGNTVYPWTGWSVDNPSNNYYYSFLRATMLLGLATRGENPQADAWLQLFRVAKIENQLVPTFNRDLAGGGSREGTGYGTAMKNLFQLYDWWYRSTGDAIAVRTPHTLASMSHLIHSIVPTLDRLAPTGDHARDSTAALFDYHREYLMVLMALFPDEPLSGVARTLLERSAVPQMKNSFMYYVDFLYDQPGIKARPLTDLATTYYGPGTGQVMMRSAWEPSATYANFICGPYTESHAHRDQGSFVIYKGAWLATDSNVFSRSGIEQDEELHNMVRFETGGATVKQRPGTTCALNALADTAHYTYASARMTANYRAQPAVVQSEREFLFIKPDTFVVFDRAAANNASTRRIWTLNLGGPPTISGDSIRYTDGKGQLDVVRLSPAGLTPTVHNWSQLRTGMQGGVRVDVADTEGSTSAFLHVLSTNGAVLSATRADAAGQTGASIKLADGRTATVRFSTKGGGATLDLRGADQSAQVSGALPTTVTAPALLAR